MASRLGVCISLCYLRVFKNIYSSLHYTNLATPFICKVIAQPKTFCLRGKTLNGSGMRIYVHKLLGIQVVTPAISCGGANIFGCRLREATKAAG